jgi:hypothetical protein
MTKTLGFKQIKDGVVLNSFKSFFKIQHKNDDFFFRMVAEMKILKSPGKAILGSSTFDNPYWFLWIRGIIC